MGEERLPLTPATAMIPDVIAARCVHSIITQARCQACAVACPQSAWVIDDERLGIDANRCDGCELCVPACPQAAIVARFGPAPRRTRQGLLAFAACERAGVRDADAPIMPCLHALGSRELLRLARAGVDRLVTARGACDQCPRGQGEQLGDCLLAVNQLLKARQLACLVHEELAPPTWEDAWRSAQDPANDQRLSRRGFFLQAIRVPVQRLRERLMEDEDQGLPPGRLLPPAAPGEPVPLAPQLETLLCTGCDACVRLCPQGALGLERAEGLGQAYVIDAASCSGCGICIDVCATGAVSLLRWQPPPLDRLPLVTQRCRACGVNFHLPRWPQDPPQPDREAPTRRHRQPLCPICFRADHAQRLFQVLPG
jgi:ferredoxin